MELDAKAILDVLTNPSQSNIVISAILDDCMLLTTSFPRSNLAITTRKQIYARMDLVRMGRQQALEFLLYETPPGD